MFIYSVLLLCFHICWKENIWVSKYLIERESVCECFCELMCTCVCVSVCVYICIYLVGISLWCISIYMSRVVHQWYNDTSYREKEGGAWAVEINLSGIFLPCLITTTIPSTTNTTTVPTAITTSTPTQSPHWTPKNHPSYPRYIADVVDYRKRGFWRINQVYSSSCLSPSPSPTPLPPPWPGPPPGGGGRIRPWWMDVLYCTVSYFLAK